MGSPRIDRAAGRAATSLLAWYARMRRDLPWRHRPDPYRVWISEIMLQQTTVAAAGPYFERFVARFPNVAALAAARESEVLALWSGLGYYRRARNLLAAARIVRDRHDGQVPTDPAALRALPGVGPYTAGAILSIGHGIPAPALDGNIIRVASRLGGVEEPVQRAATRRRLEGIVMGMMPAEKASIFNQALMDLGAMVCLPVAPLCRECPVAACCAARRSGRQAVIPLVPGRPRATAVDLVALVVTRPAGGKHQGVQGLLVKRSPGALLGGMWEFPLAPAGGSPLEAAGRLARQVGARATSIGGTIRHTITRHAIRLTLVRGEPAGHPEGSAARDTPSQAGGDGGAAAARLSTPLRPRPGRRWVELDRIASGDGAGAVTGAARKIAAMLAQKKPDGDVARITIRRNV
jgi:A/G-specific adenine glycosylase